MGEKEVLLQFKKFLVTLRFFWNYIFHFNLKVFNKLIRANNRAAEKACHAWDNDINNLTVENGAKLVLRHCLLKLDRTMHSVDG